MPISGFGSGYQSPLQRSRESDIAAGQLREQKKGRKQQLYLDIAKMILQTVGQAAPYAGGIGGFGR